MRSIDEIVVINIELRMRDLKMSQKKLALLTGLTPAYINKLLKGKKPISKSNSLPLIAQALHFESEVEVYQDTLFRETAEAKDLARKSEIADLKRMSRMFQEQAVETLMELREERSAASSIPPRVWAAWNSDKTPKKAKQLAELFLTREKAILKDMDLSLGGLKAAEELLRWVHPPKPHLKD